MGEFLQRLKQRKLIQWAMAYLAAAWVLLQVLDLAVGSYHWPDAVMHTAFGVLAVGFVLMLVLAWYHGERGAQRVSGMELLIVALVLAVGGGVLWRFSGEAAIPATPSTVATMRQPAPPASDATAKLTDLSVHAPAATSVASPIAVMPIPAKSIAVLPFENLSTSKDNAYFADGIQDLILTKLADIGDLKVISRTSTESYGSHPQNLTLVGKQLGVATILEGSVQKAGNQVLINVQLIDAKTDSHIWAHDYTRTLTNIFGVEGEVAEKVATALNTKLTAAETARVTKVPTRNPAAYDAFLQGQYYAQRAGATLLTSDFAEAAAYYRQAVSHDDQFALAWARLSHVLAQQQRMTFTGPQQSVLAAQSKAALDRALALTPDAPEVRLAQGWYEHWIAHDLKRSFAAFNAVLALQPQNAQALFATGIIRQDLGQYGEAVGLLREAVERSPNDAAFLTELGGAELDLRDYAQGLQTLRRALAIDPDSALALDTLVAGYFYAGNPDGAKALLDTASAQLQGNPAIFRMRTMVALQRRDYAAALMAAAGMKAGGRYSDAYADMLRGDVEWQSDNRDSALEYYRHATPVFNAEVKQFPDNALALSGLGWLLMRQGEGEEALADMRRAIEIARGRGDQRDADGFRWEMARALAQLGKAGQAAAILNDLMSRPSAAPVTAASLKVDWVWDPIRHDPRFQALLKKYASDARAGTPAAAAPAASAAH